MVLTAYLITMVVYLIKYKIVSVIGAAVSGRCGSGGAGCGLAYGQVTA